MNLPSMLHAGPRFRLGRIFATPAALEALGTTGVSIIKLLICHMSGDFGEVCDSDCRQNELALTTNLRVLSSYPLPNGETVWVITEADRSATTVLMPDDYRWTR